MAIIQAAIAIASNLTTPELALAWLDEAKALTCDKLMIYEIVQAKLGVHLIETKAPESALLYWHQSRLN